MCWFVVLKGYDFSGNSGRNFWTWNFVANVCLSQFKSVKNSPVSRLHDCHTRTFCILYCAPCYDYGFNNKRCWLKNFPKYLYIQRNRLWLCTPNSRSHQSSVKEVAEIAMVVLVDGEKHPAKPLYFMFYELWFHYERLVGQQLCTIKNN